MNGNVLLNNKSTNKSHSTVTFLLRRIKRSKDFPSFSKYIVEINQKLASPDKILTASDLANVILKDYGLTNKLLKVINSAFYGFSTGKVTTITRAVVLLGFNQVRMTLSSLILFDHLQNKRQGFELKNSAINSFAAGVLARDLSKDLPLNSEEVFVCSMFHNLGNHLVLYYLPEEYNEIKRKIEQEGINEHQASLSVLGISFNDLGIEVAKIWKFPETILSSMERLPKENVNKARSNSDLLRCLSNFSNDLCYIVRTTQGDSREKALSALRDRFKDALPVTKKQLARILDSSMEQLDKSIKPLGIDIKNSEFIRNLNPVQKYDKKEPLIATQSVKPVLETTVLAETTADPVETAQLAEKEPETEKILHTQNSDTEHIQEKESLPSSVENSMDVLINGIQEVTNALVEGYNLNDLTVMILETMYRGFGLNRVVLCMMQTNRTEMRARFGFGDDIENFINRFGFIINSSSRDIFNQAISDQRDIRVQDSNSSHFRNLIPEWYKNVVNAPAFIIYPIVLNKTCIGIFYGDRNQKGEPINLNQLNYLKTLRNHLLLAIKKRN